MMGSLLAKICCLVTHRNENGTRADVCGEDGSHAATPSTVYGLAVANVNSDVGQAHAAICVVDQVSGLGFSRGNRATQGQVTCRPAVVVDACSCQGVAGQGRAILCNTELSQSCRCNGCTDAALDYRGGNCRSLYTGDLRSSCLRGRRCDNFITLSCNYGCLNNRGGRRGDDGSGEGDRHRGCRRYSGGKLRVQAERGSTVGGALHGGGCCICCNT